MLIKELIYCKYPILKERNVLIKTAKIISVLKNVRMENEEE